MEGFIGSLVYLVFIIGIIFAMKKKASTGSTPNRYNTSNRPTPTAYNNGNPYAGQEPSAVPHVHRAQGQYDTFNKKSIFNESGTMPHKHETGHYTSMPDASKLPKGYILLNGEPVRVADLENK